MKKNNIVKYLLIVFCILNTIVLFAQNNRLTNEKGQLLWQYSQNVTANEEKPNTIVVSFVFINGINQTAISLRQELFNSQIEWIEIADLKVEKEDCVEFLTANLAPNQSIVWKYILKPKLVNNELILEKSALFVIHSGLKVNITDQLNEWVEIRLPNGEKGWIVSDLIEEI